MHQLFVLSFDTEEAATQALHALRGLEHEGKIHFEDTAVVTRDPDGTAHVKNEASAATEVGAGIGGMVGLMVAGVLFPVVGIAVGAAIGAGIGAHHPQGRRREVRRGGQGGPRARQVRPVHGDPAGQRRAPRGRPPPVLRDGDPDDRGRGVRGVAARGAQEGLTPDITPAADPRRGIGSTGRARRERAAILAARDARRRDSRACSSADRASASGAEGRRFESCRARHRNLVRQRERQARRTRALSFARPVCCTGRCAGFDWTAGRGWCSGCRRGW